MVGTEILYFFINFLTTPALLISAFGLAGSIIQKKKISETIISTLKIIIGFLILSGGASMLTNSLSGLDETFKALFHGNSVVIPNSEGIGGFVNSMGIIGTWSSIVMLIAMCANIILALCTKFKYIYLTGHVLFYISICVVTTSVSLGLNPNDVVDAIIIVVSGSAIISMYMVLSPALCQKYMREIIGNDDIAMGHTGSLAYLISGAIGNKIYKIKKGKVKKSDELHISDKFGWLKHSSLMITIMMTLLYSVVFITGWVSLGKDWMIENGVFKSSDSIPVQIFIKSVMFAAGIEIILFGVKMTLNEIVPAFKGISDKVIKGAKPALNCQTVFDYSKNGMLLGFLGALLGGTIVTIISVVLTSFNLNSFVIVFGVMSIYFTGSTAGVFGDNKGGVLGALIGGFVDGIFVTLIPYLFTFGNLLPTDILNNNMTWGDNDFIIGIFIAMWKWFGLNADISKWILLSTSCAAWLSLISTGFISKIISKKKDKHEKI